MRKTLAGLGLAKWMLTPLFLFPFWAAPHLVPILRDLARRLVEP